MKNRICLLLLLIVLALTPLYADTISQIAISGRIAAERSTVQTTKVTPQQNADGSTTYVVTSTVTGKQLATLDSAAAANAFVVQLNPVVPYEK